MLHGLGHHTANPLQPISCSRIVFQAVGLTALVSITLGNLFERPLQISNGPTLAERLKIETSEVHAEITRHPVVVAILSRNLTLEQYHCYLESKHIIYSALEEGIEVSLTKEPRLKKIQKLERSTELQRDLSSKYFSNFTCTSSSEAKKYKKHLEELSIKPLSYLAHYYTQFFADVSGGKTVRKRIKEMWPDIDAVHSLDFDALSNKLSLNSTYPIKDFLRAQLNNIKMTRKEEDGLVQEAKKAFELSTGSLDEIIPRNPNAMQKHNELAKIATTL